MMAIAELIMSRNELQRRSGTRIDILVRDILVASIFFPTNKTIKVPAIKSTLIDHRIRRRILSRRA